MERQLRFLIIGATGGLGKALVAESLSRGHGVSVLVRSREKLDVELQDAAQKLSAVNVGDAGDAATVARAAEGQDVVFLAAGANVALATSAAAACVSGGKKAKLLAVAGATNVMAEDGVTPDWVNWAEKWPPAERAFKAHDAVIRAIRASGVNFVVFCPPLMRAAGKKTSDLPNIRINRPSGSFISYEDAAAAMVHAAVVADYDGQLITASAKQ